jgi:hypothetical protein
MERREPAGSLAGGVVYVLGLVPKRGTVAQPLPQLCLSSWVSASVVSTDWCCGFLGESAN